MPFVLLAVLGPTVAVSVVLVLYMLVRCWLWANDLLALGSPQLPYLTVHLIEGIAEFGLQARPAVIGKVSGESPRFF
jgi:hypothetical protein